MQSYKVIILILPVQTARGVLLLKIINIFCFIPEGDDVLLVRLNAFVFSCFKEFFIKAEAWSARCAGYKQQGWDKKLVSVCSHWDTELQDSLLSIAFFPLQEQAGGLQFIEFVSHG